MTDILEGTDVVEIQLPLLVKLSVEDSNTSKEFTISVDENGYILLTPYVKEAQFDSVELDLDMNDIVDPELRRVVLITNAECSSDNRDIVATVDEIGECVIRFEDSTNKFLSVSIDDSLNIITEGVAVHQYNNYVLLNAGDGWDVKAPDGEIVEEGIATLAEAKIFVLKMELERLTALQNPDKAQEVEEQFNPLHESLCDLTCNFEDSEGTIECDSFEGSRYCSHVLSSKYHKVVESYSDTGYLIEYFDRKKDDELTDYERHEIIAKFLRGELPVQMAEGSPLDSYIPLEDLDSGKYIYFYDPESGSIPVYTREGK